MSLFVAVDDRLLAERIATAKKRIVFVAPAISKAVAEALGRSFVRAGEISITLVIDLGEDAYRVGYGEREGLAILQKLTEAHKIGLRSQSGLRIGTLITDEDILLWSPTPMAVENLRKSDEPNGIDLRAGAAQEANLTDVLREAIGADDSHVLHSAAEIGKDAATPAAIAATLDALERNPPVPIDLARQTRVLATKFEYVETELHGALWTGREVKLSNLLLNADAPDAVKALFETRIKPFAMLEDAAIEVPALVRGQIAHSKAGVVLKEPLTQAELRKVWESLRTHYLSQMRGFGWLIERSQKESFERDVSAFQSVLREWSAGFARLAEENKARLIKPIAQLVKERAARSSSAQLRNMDVERAVYQGLDRMRVTEAGVKVVFKEISWESTRDNEFLAELQHAVPPKKLAGWFEEFTATREKQPTLFNGS